MQERHRRLEQVSGLGLDRRIGEVARAEYRRTGLARLQRDALRLHAELERKLLAHLGAEPDCEAHSPVQKHLPVLPFAHQLHLLRELDYRQRAGFAASAHLGTALVHRVAGRGALAVQQVAQLRVVSVRHRAVHGHHAGIALQVALGFAYLDELAELLDQVLELRRKLRMPLQVLLQRTPAPVLRRRQFVYRGRVVDVPRVQQAGGHLLGGGRAHRQERADPGRQHGGRSRYREQPFHSAPIIRYPNALRGVAAVAVGGTAVPVGTRTATDVDKCYHAR